MSLDLSALDRHEGRIALSYSGGKDSTATLWLLRDHLHRMTVYHVDTGDQLPEVREVIAQVRAMCPQFVVIETHKEEWVKANGLPSDLVPHSSHWIGQAMAEGRTRLVERYTCCSRNLMFPLFERIKADGCTLLIRGTKASDMAKLPARSGDVGDGVEMLYPIETWSDAEVLEYLRREGAPISRVYTDGKFRHAPECARCTAWWTEPMAPYLREYHPALYADYAARMAAVRDEVLPSIGALSAELGRIGPA